MNETWREPTAVSVTGLQEKQKCISLHLEAQAKSMLHIHECCSQHDERDHMVSQTEGNDTN
jgi:hypothetical protein